MNFAHHDILHGLYRASDGRLVRVLYARGGLVHYWAIDDPATADSPAGKVKLSMTVAKFRDDGFTIDGGI